MSWYIREFSGTPPGRVSKVVLIWSEPLNRNKGHISVPKYFIKLILSEKMIKIAEKKSWYTVYLDNNLRPINENFMP